MGPKRMSDEDVTDTAWGKMMGDLDGIEADGLFSEDKPMEDPHAGVKVEANGMSVHIKPMDGEQTEDMPKIMDADEEDDELGKLGL